MARTPATAAADDPVAAVGILNVLPVILVALELGLGGGLAAAAAAGVTATRTPSPALTSSAPRTPTTPARRPSDGQPRRVRC